MKVTRCVCRGVPFRDALATAQLHGCATVADLQSHLDIGTGCGLCVSYMQRVLITGQPEQPILSEREMEDLRALAGVGSREIRP